MDKRVIFSRFALQNVLIFKIAPHMAISEQEVFEAADQIRDAGQNPSALKIREITQTGSLGTIQKHLVHWAPRDGVSPPSTLRRIRSAAMTKFGDQIWQLALQQAEKMAMVKVKEAREGQEEAQRDVEEAMEKLESWQVEMAGEGAAEEMGQELEHPNRCRRARPGSASAQHQLGLSNPKHTKVTETAERLSKDKLELETEHDPLKSKSDQR